MGLQDFLNNLVGNNAATTPAQNQLIQAGYTPYQLNTQNPETGYTVNQASAQAAQPFVSAQQGLVGQLQQQANGQGPSVAGQQLQQGQDQALRSAVAAQAGQRGGNAGVQQQQIGQNQAAISQQAAGQASQTKALEQQNAQGQLGNLASTAAGQQQQQAQFNANALNAQGQLQSTQNQNNYQFQQALQAQQASQYNQAIAALTNQQSAGNQSQGNNLVTGLVNGVGSVVGDLGKALSGIFSDETVKTAIQSSNAQTQSFLDNLSRASYAPGPGNSVSPGGDIKLALSSADGGQGQQGQGQQSPQGNPSMAAGGENAKASAAYNQGLDSDQMGAGAERMVPIGAQGYGAVDPVGIGQMTESDERAKTDQGQQNTLPFLEAIRSHSYEYKNPNMPGAAPGTHYGPMAQELERGGPMGRSVVFNTPQGKMIDTPRLTLALTSAAGQLNQRLEALEEALRSKLGKGKK